MGATNRNEGVYWLEVGALSPQICQKMSSQAVLEQSTFVALLCDTTTLPLGLMFMTLKSNYKIKL